MSEQIRIYKGRGGRRHLNSPQSEQTAREEESRKEAEEQLRKNIDAVLSVYQTSAAPEGQGEVVGQHQPHQVVRPLSDEEVVKNFRQTRGE